MVYTRYTFFARSLDLVIYSSLFTVSVKSSGIVEIAPIVGGQCYSSLLCNNRLIKDDLLSIVIDPTHKRDRWNKFQSPYLSSCNIF